jgi:hypothetical protein
LLFLLLGVITAAHGVLLFAVLLDSPSIAVFLNENERAVALQRTLENQTGVMDNGSFKWDHAIECV